MNPSAHWKVAFVFALAGSLIVGCGSNSVPSTSSAVGLSQISGDGQKGTVGIQLPQAFIVKVVDKDGVGVPGVSVVWGVATGNGQLVPVNPLTNGDGESSAVAVPGAGANSYTATSGSLAGSPITFNATGVSGNASLVAKASGDNQTGSVNSALALPLTVLVTDTANNPVMGVPVAFAVGSYGVGSVTPASATTSTAGTATATATLGSTLGPQTFLATVTLGVSNVTLTFSASAKAGKPATITLVSGENQSGSARFPLQTLTVKVTDAYGNPTVGEPVSFAAGLGGGSVSAASVDVQWDGTASVIATLGPTLGPATFTATVPSIEGNVTGSPVTFHATSKGLLANPTGGGALMGTAATVPLSVTVTDYAGLGLPNVSVNWSVVSGDGTLPTPAISTSDASGVATINATTGQNVGADQFHATAVEAAPAVDFTVNVL